MRKNENNAILNSVEVKVEVGVELGNMIPSAHFWHKLREPTSGSLDPKMTSKDTKMAQKGLKWPEMAHNSDKGRCHNQKMKLGILKI